MHGTCTCIYVYTYCRFLICKVLICRSAARICTWFWFPDTKMQPYLWGFTVTFAGVPCSAWWVCGCFGLVRKICQKMNFQWLVKREKQSGILCLKIPLAFTTILVDSGFYKLWFKWIESFILNNSPRTSSFEFDLRLQRGNLSPAGTRNNWGLSSSEWDGSDKPRDLSLRWLR